MIEQSQRPLPPLSAGDLVTLQRRASRQHKRQVEQTQAVTVHQASIRTALAYPSSVISQLPSRFLLHAVALVTIPAAVLLSTVSPVQRQSALSVPAVVSQNIEPIPLPVAPISINTVDAAGDDPIEESADLPVPLSFVSRSATLAPTMIQVAIAGDQINLRNGPGTDYDVVDRLTQGAALQVIGKFNDWFQVRERFGAPVHWISGELLSIDDSQVALLDDVPQSLIPPPPPPKIGQVREDSLALRDGPGTNYVSIKKLDAGAQLDLLEIYQDWFHVGTRDGDDGWVKGDFLVINDGVINRLTVTDTVPDPAPNLVGKINDNKVNLRKGPDSRYARVNTVNAGLVVDLLGKYDDWYKVRLEDGTKAWIFSDLLNVSAHVLRRVPLTKDFPKLPTAPSRSVGRTTAGVGLSKIKASGDVASFAAQFVGYRYRWGGSSPRNGFDCSGLLVYSYAQYGISLPRTAASQFSGGGVQVGGMENLSPGDLVFFVNTDGRRGITHAGMYIGGGRIVHAMSPRYGVQISSLYDRYWSSRYYGAVRPRR